MTSRVHCTAMPAPRVNASMRDLADRGKVVIAGEAHGGVLARELDTGIGIGAVSDQITEAPELRGIAGGDRLEHGFEGLPVAVDVGDDCDLHHCRV